MGAQKCLICLARLTDPSFNSDNAKILCQLLRLPLDYPISSEMCSFPDLFESASYCPPCVWKVKAIGHILKDIEQLERRLEEHRSIIEEQFKNNMKIVLECPKNDLDYNANHLVWTSVINYIENSGCGVVTENENLEFTSEQNTVDPLEIDNEGQGEACMDYDPELSPVSSPSNQNHEEKYDPSQDDVEAEACFSDPTTPSSGEIKSLAVSSKIRRKRPRPRAPPRTRCWFVDDCNIRINKYDHISSEAHRLRYHEGVKKCYICKICNEGFVSRLALKTHANSHVLDEDLDNLNSVTLTLSPQTKKDANSDLPISQNFDPKKISEIMKSPFPIIRLTRLDDIAIAAAATEAKTASRVKVKLKPVAKRTGSHSQRAKLNQKPRKKLKRTGQNKSSKCPYEGCRVRFRVNDVKWQEAHIWLSHESKKEDYFCGHGDCPARFASLEKWHGHITTEHNGGIPAPYSCPFCQLDCVYFLPLRQHVFSVHEPHKAKYKCEIPGCGKLFQDQRKLDDHKVTHEPRAQVQNYLCEFCSETFTNPQRLKYHRTSKHATEANLDPYKCETCGDTFASPPNLRDHVRRIHEKAFKFKCKLCGHGAMNKSEFEKHQLRAHKSERPFMCDKCPATFKVKMGLYQHAKRHVGIRAFKCSICPATFVMKTGLTRHELIHSKAQCHVCTICGRTFPIRNYLTLHMLNFHKIRTNAKKSNSTSTTTGPNVEINEKLSNVFPPEEPQNYPTATSGNNEFEDFVNF